MPSLEFHPPLAPMQALSSDTMAADNGRSVASLPLKLRREQLENVGAQYFQGNATIRLSPLTAKLSVGPWIRPVADRDLRQKAIPVRREIEGRFRAENSR